MFRGSGCNRNPQDVSTYESNLSLRIRALHRLHDLQSSEAGTTVQLALKEPNSTGSRTIKLTREKFRVGE
jgi:hypothetical protein